MPSIDESTRVAEDLFNILAKRPITKDELCERFRDKNATNAEAMGTLRVFGLVESGSDKSIRLTPIGHYVANHLVRTTATDLIKAFRRHRGSSPGTKSYAGGPGFPSHDALAHGLNNVSARSIRDLIKIRGNVLQLLERELAADLRFGLDLYVAAIDREFEERPSGENTYDDDWFKWPTTNAPEGFGTIAGADFMTQGMLSALGYRVGVREGVAEADRRRLLDQIFVRALPPLFPRWYMDKWGVRGTASRLRTLAYTIAQLAKNLKHKRDDRMDTAIRNYEVDLLYLYETYYAGKFHFDWPTTSLR